MMKIERRAAMRWLGWLAMVGLLWTAGCMSPSIEDHKLARWLPATQNRAPWQWSQDGTGGGASTPVAARGETTDPGSVSTGSPGVRPLKQGDRLAVSLVGIEEPIDLVESVDDRGEITLPLIGSRRVEGLTSSEAEKLLVNAYVSEGYYKKGKINIILVAQEEEYFVRGEVKSPGRKPLSREITLLKAIATAGGYTDFARASRIKVIRGDEVLEFDAGRIESRRSEDPRIKPGDIIVVPRTIF